MQWAVDRLWYVVFDDEDRAFLLANPVASFGDWQFGKCVRMWQARRGGSDHRALFDVAYATGYLLDADRRWLLREYEEDDEPLSAAAAASSIDTLLIQVWPRAAFWEGARIPIEWGRFSALWEYFLLLARRSQTRSFIDASDFRSVSEDPKYLSKTKSRLTRLEGFPAALKAKIQIVDGCQRLDLPRARIQILEADADSPT